MRNAFCRTLLELAARDPRIYLFTGDLGYSVLEPFQRQLPARFLNVGVAEQNLIGIAAGAASCGKVVFTYSIANFPTLRCLEHIRNDVCLHGLPVKIVAVGGGYAYGPQGYTHHGLEDLGALRLLPGLHVFAPGDPVETACAVRASVALPGPCYLRLGKGQDPVVHTTPPDFAVGRALQLREGRDVTLISTGGILPHVLDVAAQLAKEGIAARVLSMHTLKPLDDTAVRAAFRETRAVVTVEEHSVVGGLGAAVASAIVTAGGPLKPFRQFAAPDRIHKRTGSQAFLRRLCGDLAELVRAALADAAPQGR